MSQDTKTRILEQAIRLFALHGYDAVSLRDIAGQVGISAPALYNHYANKEALYQAAVERAFSKNSSELIERLSGEGPATRRLADFITAMAHLAVADREFLMLMQREWLDGDERRLRLLADGVFQDLIAHLQDLARELDPDCDPHLLSVSITGLVVHHLQTAPLRRLLPGHLPEHEEPDLIARHVLHILLNGVAPRHETAN